MTISKKLISNLFSLCICFGLMIAAPMNTHAQTASAQNNLEAFIETLKKMEFPVKDVANQAHLVSEAGRFLDLDAVGKKAVADHWAEANEEQRTSFLDLFSKLIEKTAYPRSHDFLSNVKITYPETSTDAAGTVIKSVVHDPNEGLDTEVIYHLSLKEGEWIIVDVILDDVSIVEDLKYQFDKIVKDSSFDGLLVKLKERLEQPDAPAPTKTA